jgi:hypothetical protein
MINIELLARNALNRLKQYPNFPKSGFIAGGSLANLIWESISGNKAIINDIDVFIFNKIIEKSDDGGWIRDKNDPKEDKKLYYDRKETVYVEDYAGLCQTSKSTDFYLIEDTSHWGIYNFVNYSANRQSPQVIIDSFDINCTQVGYSIDEDKFYYTDDFEYFLKTGELHIVNLMSPGHSAIRLIKKKYDLNAKLDELELKLCQHCLVNKMSDTNRIYFTEKYAKIYRKYQSELQPYFSMKKSEEITELFLKNKNLDLEIFHLECYNQKEFDMFLLHNQPVIFDDPLISKINNGIDLLFYVRNINGENKDVWNKLHYLYDSKDYVDKSDFSKEDLDMLSRLVRVAPNTIKNLKGLKLSQQISIMKILFDKYKEDPLIAISVLEKIKIDPNASFDEGDLLLLELSVRKLILNDTRDKVKRILYPEALEVRQSEIRFPDLGDLFN